MESLERILATHPFFEGVDAQTVKRFAGCASNHKWDSGATIFREGDPAEQVYLLREGQVAVELIQPARDAIMLETLDGGDVLGWSWLLPPYHWHFEARAVTPVRALALHGACLRRKCAEDHEFGYILMKRMCEVIARRLAHATMQLLDVYGAR